MRPFFFGRSERLLFGTYHAPAVRSPRPSAVLLCNPFGQEAIRAHRIYATLATRLSKAGQHVLRFDYYGTGDSAGDVAEGSQPGWIEDVLEAHEELQASSGVSRVIWVGLRYGATLAVLAGRSLRRSIEGVILWDPVVDGAAYVKDLGESHTAFMRQDMRNWRPSGPAGSESLGFPLGSTLRHEMGTLDLATGTPPKARRVTVLATNQTTYSQGFRDAVSGWADPIQWSDVATSSPWNSDGAMNSMLVPVDVLDAIVAESRGVHGSYGGVD